MTKGSLEPGFQFHSGKYTILSYISRGSQAEVYKVRSKTAVFALKYYSHTDFFGSEDIRQIMKEGIILKQLTHENIVKCHDIIQTETEIFIILDLLDGIQLDTFIQNQFALPVNIIDRDFDFEMVLDYLEPCYMSPDIHGIYQDFMRRNYKIVEKSKQRMSESQTPLSQPNVFNHRYNSSFDGSLYFKLVSQIFYQLVCAFSYLHDQNIMHRDLKPENVILIFDKGRFIPKVVDFGFVSLRPRSGQFVGTPGYLAPEIACVKNKSELNYDQKIDVWDLGCVLFYFLAGYPPFVPSRNGGFMQFQMQKALFLPMDLNPESVDSKVYHRLMQHMLAVDPTQRYDTKQIIAYLEQHIGKPKDLLQKLNIDTSKMKFKEDEPTLEIVNFTKKFQVAMADK